MITKCPCVECGANIEFEAEGAGETIACPHCGKNTVLFISGQKKIVTVQVMPPVQATAATHSNLFTCPDCGNQISKSAESCPHCGRPLLTRARAYPQFPDTVKVETRGRDSARKVKIISTLMICVSIPGCMVSAGFESTFMLILCSLFFWGGLLGFIVGRFME
jgi:predicted RNA-binding Zn-ribbon protein involved in translation (DUF1610 family)